METRVANKKDLWLRLRNYHFDHLVPPHVVDHVQALFAGSDASTHAFADKLARKLGWSVPFALRAIDEYKKFVYLGVTADFPVTPSKVIDQVWHEHLLFTRGYRAFCADLLGREFDHNPELIPLDELTSAFRQQYDATLDLYQAEFNREAPTEFWGTPKFAGRRTTPPRTPLRRRRDSMNTSSGTPLYAYFGDSGDGGGGSGSGPSMPEFGGGQSGGAGGGASWPDSGGHQSAPSDSTAGGHDGGGGNGGSDGGGDGGGSGCSSGCSGSCGSS